MEQPAASRNRIGHVFRVLRPLLWWLVLVLVLYGIRVHERLVAETRLFFSVSLHGQIPPYSVSIRLDGKSFASGDKVSMGNHRLEIASGKTDPYTTNFFIWYGRHDLGDIALKRCMGTLDVKANPPAPSITITGPEFTNTLYDCASTNLTVPTDQYTVRAQYAHWSESQKTTVFANLAASCVFSPELGVLRLTSNKRKVTYRLDSADGQMVNIGSMPAMVVGLPTGKYEVVATYHNRRMQESVTVATGTTNKVPIQFILGAVRLETTPPGAGVYTANGDYVGQTPLLLSGLPPQKAKFNLSLAGYEPASVTLAITANQTNSYRTNLVSVNYVSAMQDARAYLAASNYEAAVQAADAALNARPKDAEALALQKKANKDLKAEQERLATLTRPKRTFDGLCSEYQDAGLFSQHELTTDKSEAAVTEAVIAQMTSAPGAFKIISDNTSEPGVCALVAQQSFSLGILGGTERDALIVVGQAKKNETQVWFKVLEYAVQNTVVADGLLKFHDNKRLVAVNPSTMQMNSGYEAQLRNGVLIVRQRLEKAIAL